MNAVMKILSWVGLGATIVPCLLLFAGLIDLSAVKWLALVGTILWFLTTPVWMGRALPIDATEVEI